jgi:hypothetical protein
VVILTNPIDLTVDLQQAAQQLIGQNDTNQANVQAFVDSYHHQETAFQTGQTNVQPATPQAAAQAWINQYFPTQVEANRFLQDSNAIDCMIKNDGPCPSSNGTGTTP